MSGSSNSVEKAILQKLLASFPPLIGVGRIFYVDHFTGDNANSGTEPGTPFETITYALTQCVADRNDYIILLNVWDAEPAFPVVIDVPRVHIIGQALPTPWGWQTINGGGNNVFQLAEAYCEIAYISFTSLAAIAIDVTGAGPYGWIHHCNFASSSGLGLSDGIVAAGGGLAHGLIEDCEFSNTAVGGAPITGNAITGGLTNVTIRRNIFKAVAGICINIDTVTEVGGLYDNGFLGPIALALAAGWAITLGGATAWGGGPIYNNHATQAGDGTGNNPFRDLSTALLATNTRGWGMNYMGQAVIAPDVV